MGLFAELRDAFRRGRTGAPQGADTTAGAVAASPPPHRAQTARGLATGLHAEFPDRVPIDDLFGRAEAAGLDVQAVDRALDEVREATSVKVLRVRVSALTVVDLASLDSVRTRIKGSSYYVTDAERPRYGGPEYLLVREPDNAADSSAVAVYGRGRKVGHLSAARAASLTPLLDGLGADAYRVTGTGTSSNSIVLWVDAPKVDALRKFVRAQR